MTRQDWFAAGCFCFLGIILYCGHVYASRREIKTTFPLEKKQISKKTELSNTLDKNIVKKKKNDSEYQNLLMIAGKEEKAGHLKKAAWYYNLAYNLQPGPELAKRLHNLENNLRLQSDFGLLNEKSWETANILQEKGQYQKALVLYRQLSEKYSTQQLQTKLNFCRRVIRSEKLQQDMLNKADHMVTKGEWHKASIAYQDMITRFSETKLPSQVLASGLTKAKNRLNILQIYRRELNRYLQGRRPVMAWRVAREITQLPNKGIVEKLEKKLQKTMAWVSPGPFVMGDNSQPDESPQRVVSLPGYYIDRYEVTNKDYLHFVRITGYRKPKFWEKTPRAEIKSTYPVVGVSWKDAVEYAGWKGKRLPTEAEWEKAARGSSGKIYSWGNQFEPRFSNCLEAGLKRSTKVGSYEQGKSEYGCYDMIGNVQEWTADIYKPYPGGKEPRIVRRHNRVIRGGGWYNPGNALRASNRHAQFQEIRLKSIGFRCALSKKR